MATKIYQKYAIEWIGEAIVVGVILGIIAFALVAIGGVGTILVIFIFQFLGAALLIYSLFSKVELMIRELTGIEVTTTTNDPVQAPELSHHCESDSGDKEVFKISGKTRSANFIVDSDGIRVKSRIDRWFLDDNWVQEATEYLETVVDADKE